MMKTLRYFLVAALAMMSFSAMAEDIIWAEDFSSYKADDVPTGGTYSYVCTGSTKIYADGFAGGTAPELLLGKNGGTFKATIALNGKSGAMSLAYMTNYDERVTVSVNAGVTIGEKSKSGNSILIPLTVTDGVTSIELTFTNTTKSNARLDNIKLYQGTAKKPAGLSWGKASTQVTYGDTDSYTKYLPTLQNSNNLTITCTSTDEKVATVTNEGVITVVGAGETILSAIFVGNDEYEAQTVNFTLTVKPAPSTETVWDFTVLPTQKIEKTGNMDHNLGDAGVFVNDDGASWQIAYNVADFPEGSKLMATATEEFTPTKDLVFSAMSNKQTVIFRNYPAAYGGIYLFLNRACEFMVPAKAGQTISLDLATTNGGGATKKITSQDVVETFDDEGTATNGIKAELDQYNYKTFTLTAKVENVYLAFEGNVCIGKITVKDGGTGIAAVKTANKVANNVMYNLAGQKVDAAYKGMVIMNGRKFMNK